MVIFRSNKSVIYVENYCNFTESFGMKKYLPDSEYDVNIKEGVGSFMGFEGLTGILVKIQVFWMLNCVGCKQLTVC